MIQLKSELFTRLHAGGKPRVLEALQSAVELEHATIPLYLYSLYSLDEKSNRAIAGIIQSVVIEEMLHMTLACNILNALGGSPVVDSPTFIPAYPGPLPGGVEDQLVVQLAPFSYEQLETFITVEEPEDPLEFPLVAAAAAPAKPLTIGQFYQEIARQITALGDNAFVPGPRNQIGPDQMDDAVIVTNTSTALKAINIIIDQGEGTSNSPLEQVGSDYAHYYRYMEIKMGRRLVPTPGTQPPAYS